MVRGAVEENEARKGGRVYSCVDSIFKRVLREGLLRRVSHVHNLDEDSGQQNSMCKGPGARVLDVCEGLHGSLQQVLFFYLSSCSLGQRATPGFAKADNLS